MPDAGVEDVIKYLDLYIHIFHHKPLSHSGEMNLQIRISTRDNQGQPGFSFLFEIGVLKNRDRKVTKQMMTAKQVFDFRCSMNFNSSANRWT